MQEDCFNCWPLSGWRRTSLCPVFICLCSISSRVLWFHNDSQLIWRTVYNLSVLSLSIICILQSYLLWAFCPSETWCLPSSVWQDNCTSSTVVLNLLLLSGLFLILQCLWRNVETRLGWKTWRKSCRWVWTHRYPDDWNFFWSFLFHSQVFRCLHKMAPEYLSIYRHPVSGISGRRHLRSTDHGHLDFPRVKLASYRHTEDVHLHTPALRDLRDSSLSLSCFKRHLKTYIHSTRLAHPERLGFFYKNALYKFAFIIITLLAVAADLMHWLDDFRSAVMVTPRSLSSWTDSSSSRSELTGLF